MGAGRLIAWKAKQEAARTSTAAYSPIAITNWQQSTRTRTPIFSSASSSLVQCPQLDKPLSAKVRLNIGTADNPIFLVGKLANVKPDGNCFFNALQQSALTWKAGGFEECSAEDNTIGMPPISRQAIDWQRALNNLTQEQRNRIENIELPYQKEEFFNKKQHESFTLQNYFDEIAKDGTHIPATAVCQVIAEQFNMDIIISSLQSGTHKIPDKDQTEPIELNTVAEITVDNPSRRAIIVSNGVESSSGHFFAFVPESFNSANDNANPLQEYQDLAKETVDAIADQLKGWGNWLKKK